MASHALPAEYDGSTIRVSGIGFKNADTVKLFLPDQVGRPMAKEHLTIR